VVLDLVNASGGSAHGGEHTAIPAALDRPARAPDLERPEDIIVNFGTFLLMQSPSARSSQEIFARGVEVAQAAETLGFRNVWLAEHHFSTYGYLSRPVQLATYIAAKTKTLRVGTAVIVVPLHHPLVIAEEIATLDLLAGGRVDIGLGRGYQHYEFERFGLELSSSRARWDEAVDVLLLAFQGKPFAYDGKLYKIPETTIFPQPLQQPHPPIWITAQSPDSVEAAVRRGFNVLTGGFGVPLERMGEFRRLFDRVVAEVKPAQPLHVGVQRAVYVTDSEADARAAAEEARWNMRVTLSLRNQYERVEKGRAVPVPAPKEPDIDDLLDRFLVIGTPDTVIRQIKRVQDVVGITHFNCSFWFGDLEQARVLRSMERFARDVMPAFR
jgi:luciferase family oxidoreductase group 1